MKKDDLYILSLSEYTMSQKAVSFNSFMKKNKY